MNRGGGSPVRARLLLGLVCAVSVLVILDLSVGLTGVGWAAGAAFDAATLCLIGRAWARVDAQGRHPADLVTLIRATLVGGVVALVAESFSGPVNVSVLVGMAALVIGLDAADGQLARRTHTQSAVGARFDMEVDAFLILALSVYVASSLGAWVLLIGLARYGLLAAGYLWPWLQQPSPPRFWAKAVAAVQGIVLTVVAADVLPRSVEIAVTVVALALLTESFARQVVWLARERSRQHELGAADGASVAEAGWRPGARTRAAVAGGLTVVAVAVVWLALALPDRLERLTPGTFVQIPIEGLLLAAAALLLPIRPRRVLAAMVGIALGVLVLLKVLDMGFYAELNRAFNPIIEWNSLGSAIGVLRDSVGSAWANVLVVGAMLLAVAVVALLAWASLRVARRSAAHRRGSAWIVGVLGVAWIASATAGFDVVPHTPVASRSTTTFAAAEVRNFAAAARDRQLFADQLALADPYSETPTEDLLAGLRGKDVIIAFVESYGQVAIEGSTFAPGVVSVLDDSTKALDAAGFSSRSAFLTSPTFGGISWLAHSTLQSGLWVENKQWYSQLMVTERLTLSSAFNQAGWRTVGDDPANAGAWPEGTSFYHYDQLYNANNTGYQGPRFSYATMPDQYTLAAFQRLELTPGHAPVMAEINLVSSHIPWTPLPHMIDWADVGDGSVYEPMSEQGPSAAEVYRNDDELKAAYGRSIQYSLESLISFVQNVDDDNLVLILLGDHQPSPRVSGPNASHDVPITIITRDPVVMDRISSWNWDPGLRPGADAPVWPMDAFRNRFLDAFNRLPTE